jgi:hypothetical protein
MLYKDERDYILSGPHEFLCDACRFSVSAPFSEVYDYGKCFYCDNLGFHQVYRTEDNWVEIIMRGFVWVLIVAVVLLFIWVSYRH